MSHNRVEVRTRSHLGKPRTVGLPESIGYGAFALAFAFSLAVIFGFVA